MKPIISSSQQQKLICYKQINTNFNALLIVEFNIRNRFSRVGN